MGKGYNTTNLKRYRKFYSLIEKGATLSHQLNWSHYVEILSINDINAINYYIKKAIVSRIDIRSFRIIIKSNEYERLPIETKNKLEIQEKLEIKDLISNPILIRNKNNIDVINEKILHQLILEDISSFMKELGNGYSFIDSEYKLKIL